MTTYQRLLKAVCGYWESSAGHEQRNAVFGLCCFYMSQMITELCITNDGNSVVLLEPQVGLEPQVEVEPHLSREGHAQEACVAKRAVGFLV